MTHSNREPGRRKGRVPVIPVLRTASLRIGARSNVPSLLDAKNRLLTTSGRAAISLALEQLEIGPGDEILVPAYHCLAMTGPILAKGAEPVFYRLHPDLTIDLDDISKRAGPKTRAMLAVHFFGFPLPLSAVRAWCDRTRVALIEDCAHTLYGTSSEGPVGRTGDFAIGSLMKFHPVFDGGCLVSFRRQLRTSSLESRGAIAQIKTAVDTIERAAQWSESLPSRMIRGSLRAVRAAARAVTPSLAEELSGSAPSAATGGVQFDAAWARSAMSCASHAILKLANHRRLIERRRNLFHRYSDALRSVAGGKPFLDRLTAGAVPYVFPFLLANPERSFDALWEAGVPMYRWEDVAINECSTAKAYQQTLVQFPCHQELSDDQIEWLLTTIVDTLRRSSRV
jgi:perosamine synthetase